MKRMFWLILAASLVLLLSACHGPMHQKMQHHGKCGSCDKMAVGQQMHMQKAGPCCKVDKAAKAPAAEMSRADVLYACDCGKDCDCNTLAKQPGKCACGKDLRWHHVLKVEQDEALLCTCKEGCNCKIDPNDASKCSCGNPVKRVSLKDSGLYFCNCGGACTCNTVKDAPGECRCGMPLKQVN